MRHANYRAVADDSRITRTHWHIATANGLGWGFDGMDGVIFALVSPLIIKEFALSVPEYRTGLQISLFVGIAGSILAMAFRPLRTAHVCWRSISPCSPC